MVITSRPKRFSAFLHTRRGQATTTTTTRNNYLKTDGFQHKVDCKNAEKKKGEIGEGESERESDKRITSEAKTS